MSISRSWRRPMTPPSRWARLKTSWLREWMPWSSFRWIPLQPDRWPRPSSKPARCWCTSTASLRTCEMALDALQAIKAAGKIGKIPVGGTDESHDALESMDKGELNNTVFQDPVGQGDEAINAAYLIAKKQPNSQVVDGIIWIRYQKITKENYELFMKWVLA